MPIEITWQHGGRQERRALDGRGPFTIGRSSGGDIMLDHPQVSRVHVEVMVEGASVRVEDKGSQNGTRLDGRRITTATWAPGQQLQIGPFSLGYSWIAASEAPVRERDRCRCGMTDRGAAGGGRAEPEPAVASSRISRGAFSLTHRGDPRHPDVGQARRRSRLC